MRNLLAVIFDLDDTLYPECQYVRSGMSAVARWVHERIGHDRQQTESKLLQILAEHGSGRVFNLWLAERQLDESRWVSCMIEAYRLHEPEIDLHEGVRDLLRRLSQSHRLGIVTDGHFESQTRKVASLGIEPLFDAVVYSDQLGREFWKPSTRPFEVVIDRLAVDPRRAVYVGDNPRKDFRGAKAVGMQTIRVRYPSGLHYEEESVGLLDSADGEISDLRELPGCLDLD